MNSAKRKLIIFYLKNEHFFILYSPMRLLLLVVVGVMAYATQCYSIEFASTFDYNNIASLFHSCSHTVWGNKKGFSIFHNSIMPLFTLFSPAFLTTLFLCLLWSHLFQPLPFFGCLSFTTQNSCSWFYRKKKLAHVENRVEQFIEILRDIMNISRATFTFYFLLPASRPVSLVLYLPLNTRQREILWE